MADDDLITRAEARNHREEPPTTTKNIELEKLTELKEWIEAAGHLAL